MRFSISKFILFTLITVILTVVIFMVEVFLFSSLSLESEEQFLDPSIYDEIEESREDYMGIAEKVLEKQAEKEEAEKRKKRIQEKLSQLEKRQEEELSSASEVYFEYVPESFVAKEKDSTTLSSALKNKLLETFYEKLTVLLYENRLDVRGKMKNKTIKLYGPQDMKKDELLGVFIHEFAHYIDLYFLEREDYKDISNRFYELSWYSTIVMNQGQEGKDFVSGYAMTNKYEDFAESLTYYIFHNKDFVEKTKKSSILERKYRFISEYIFTRSAFVNTDFSSNNEVKDYYRDITKIPFSEKNFLQFIQNSI